MRIQVPNHVLLTLGRELKAARRREVGGVLVAERLGGDLFRIVDLSIQRDGGSSLAFERDPEKHRTFLDAFFVTTGHDFERFNYFGEWHSHPNAAAMPSLKDLQSMYEIVSDNAVNAPFAVLLIARRTLFGNLDLSATEFRCGHGPVPAQLAPEDASSRKLFRDVATIRRRSWRPF